MIDRPTRGVRSNAPRPDRMPVHQRDGLQKILIAALADVLKVKLHEIDIAKNFDEYGLDSIDAVIATEWIGKRLGVALPPEFLFVFRSIDAVTNALLSGDYRQASPRSRPLTQTPVFLFPGGGGIDEAALIRFREQAAPRLMFEVIHLDRWHIWIEQGFKLEDLAIQAAEYVNAKSPQGPIMLAGYSQGGQLAYVTALALENMGRPVELVFLLDTSSDVFYRTSASKRGIFSGALILCRDFIATKIRGGTFFPPGRKWVHLVAWLWDKRGGPGIVMTVMRFGRPLLPGEIRVRGDKFIQMRAFSNMWGDWTEENKTRILQESPVVLFRSEDSGSPDLGWKAYCSKLTVVPVKGDHHSMLTSEGLVDQFITEVVHADSL